MAGARSCGSAPSEQVMTARAGHHLNNCWGWSSYALARISPPSSNNPTALENGRSSATAATNVVVMARWAGGICRECRSSEFGHTAPPQRIPRNGTVTESSPQKDSSRARGVNSSLISEAASAGARTTVSGSGGNLWCRGRIIRLRTSRLGDEDLAGAVESLQSSCRSKPGPAHPLVDIPVGVAETTRTSPWAWLPAGG
jgi:hypothetical protein